MTVKLSFRTKFEDVPRDIKMLINDLRSNLQAISGSKLQYALDALATTDPQKASEVAAMLKTVQVELAKSQSRVEDCITILEHYHSISYQQQGPSESE
jgi:hypothetical protein